MGSGGSEAGVGGDSQRERGRQRQRQRLMRRGGGQGGRWGRGGGWGRTRGDWASTVAWWSGDSGVGREVSKAHEAPGGGRGTSLVCERKKEKEKGGGGKNRLMNSLLL